MENKICAVTEASDKFFHLTRTSIYSFIEHNKWFDGTIKLLVHQDLPLSEKNKTLISSIYPKLEVINITLAESETLHDFLKIKKNPKYFDMLYSLLKLYVFKLKQSKLLYFSNSCLFLKNISEVLIPNNLTFDSYFSLGYIDCENIIFENIKQFSANLTEDTIHSEISSNVNCTIKPFLSIKSSQITNSKFQQSSRLIMDSRCIIFNTQNTVDKYNKINQLWLHKNHEVVKFMNKPSSFNYNTNTNTKKYSVIPDIISKTSLKKPEKINESVLLLKSGEKLASKKLAICTICNDSFLVGTKVLIYSFLSVNHWYHHDIVIFYSKNISPLSTKSMNELSLIYSNIKFIEVDESNYSTLMQRLKSHGTDSRFFPSLFTFEAFDLAANYDKVLYLDSDMIVRSDISELFLIPENIVVTPDAGVYDLSANYFKFNGGFLLIDSKCSKFNYKKELISSGEKSNNLYLADQSILNTTIGNRVKMLNSKYNCLKRCFPDNNFSKFDENIKIVHYVGAKPWMERKSGKELNYKKIESLWNEIYLKMKNKISVL